MPRLSVLGAFTVALSAMLAAAAVTASATVVPPEGITLSQIHLLFEWPAVAGATTYDLEVVVDGGAPDPFDGVTPVIDLNVSASKPRTEVTSGLSFGQSYAWRTRGDNGSPLPWGPTRRFDIAAIPANFPSFSITTFGGSMQPGLTLFDIRPGDLQFPGGYLVAVTLAGQLVWFLHLEYPAHDSRLLSNGRVLYTSNNRAFEMTLNGQLAYATPDDSDYRLHHEAYPMPNGDLLTLVKVQEDTFYNNETRPWRGDRVIVLDRDDNSVLWDWNTFDYLSINDIDQTTYDEQAPIFDWTHTNAAVYDAANDEILISIRNLSRILTIDYGTQNIVYSMGFPKVSGDASFGDNLFSFQHAVELQPDGDILIYDNGNRRDHTVQTEFTGVTKAVEVRLAGGDPPTSASIVWSYTLPTYNPSIGDADRLANGNTLVVAGEYYMLHEVDSGSSEVWRLELNGTGNYWIRRSERIDSLLVDLPGDTDFDGYADLADNCPDHYNANQADLNADGFGDTCSIALGLQAGDRVELPEPIPALPPLARALLAGGLLASGLLAVGTARARRFARRS